MAKFVLVVLLIGLTVGVYLTSQNRLSFRPKAETSYFGLFSGYDSHPNYWSAGGRNYTAKQYIRLPSTPSLGADINWVWSGPNADGSRFVVYQPYPNGVPGPVIEWEKWTGDPTNHLAINHSYGGNSEQTNRKAYSSFEQCQNNQTGYIWPNLSYPSVTASVAQSMRDSGGCPKAGSVTVKIVDFWSTPGSTVRNDRCNSYIPATLTKHGNNICKAIPYAGIVYQRYVAGSSSDPTIGYYGCEATVYGWGSPNSSIYNFRDWFRNGELRWSNYLGLGNFPISPGQSEDWWDGQCARAFTERTNWVYSGNYKLTNDEFVDTGKDGFVAQDSKLVSMNVPGPIAGSIDRKITFVTEFSDKNGINNIGRVQLDVGKSADWVSTPFIFSGMYGVNQTTAGTTVFPIGFYIFQPGVVATRFGWGNSVGAGQTLSSAYVDAKVVKLENVSASTVRLIWEVTFKRAMVPAGTYNVYLWMANRNEVQNKETQPQEFVNRYGGYTFTKVGVVSI